MIAVSQRHPQNLATTIVATGLTKLDQLLLNIGQARTRFGALRISLDIYGEDIIRGGADAAQQIISQEMLKNQYNKDSWFERIVYKSPEKIERQKRYREYVTTGGGIAAWLVLHGLIEGGKYLLNRSENEAISTSIYQLLRFAAQRQDGTLLDQNEAILRCILDPFNLSEKSKDKLLSNPQNLFKINKIPRLEQKEIEFLSYIAYALVAMNELQKCEDKQVPLHELITARHDKLRAIYQVLKIRGVEAEELIERNGLAFERDRDVLSEHYEVISQLTAEIVVTLPKIDGQRLLDRASLLASYDPDVYKRKKNLEFFKKVACGGLVISTYPLTGSGSILAALTTVYAGTQALLSDGDPERKQLIESSFEKMTNRLGVDQKDVSEVKENAGVLLKTFS